MRSLAIASLSIRDFRNLAQRRRRPGAAVQRPLRRQWSGQDEPPRGASTSSRRRGAFGRRGSTSSWRSVRTTASVRGRVVEEGEEREQSVGLRRGLRATRIDGKRPPSLAAYALRDAGRRLPSRRADAVRGWWRASDDRLLDRIALHASPASLAHRSELRPGDARQTAGAREARRATRGISMAGRS